MSKLLRVLIVFITMGLCSHGVTYASNDDISPEYPFNIQTTDMAPGTEFIVHISAKGTFTIDWGDNDSENNIRQITRNNTSRATYSHVYENGGVHTIKFGGNVISYATNDVAAIDFDSNTNIHSLYGSIGKIFHTINDGSQKGEQPRFYNLFHLCTSIRGTIPPELFNDVHGAPVTAMFRGVFDMSDTEEVVLSGTIPGNLFAGIVGAPAENVFRSTFYGCHGLTGSIPPELFSGLSGAPAINMFYNTFRYCAGLTGSIPENIFENIVGTPADYMYAYTFANCSGLTGEIPGGLFAGISGEPAQYMYAYTFGYDTGLTGNIPADLFAGMSGPPEQYIFYGTFYDCSGLTGEIPPTLFSGLDGYPAKMMFNSTFYNCSGLTGSVPETLFSGIYGEPAPDMFRATFYGCSELTGYIPYMLFAHINGVGDGIVSGFSNTFSGANALQKACPVGMGNIIRPDSNWKVAFCGGCLLGQYRENDDCKSCPSGYSFGKAVGESINDCKIQCLGGSYMATPGASKCTNVGSEYYAPDTVVSYGDTSPRYQCPAGLKTTGHGRGADELADCGKTLHIGDEHTLHLRSEQTTHPALAILVGNQTFYADMGQGDFGLLRTMYKNKKYSIYDETDKYGDAGIPADFVRLSYIESHNFAYIDTGFLPSLDLDIYYLAYIPPVSGDEKTAVYWIEQGASMQYYASAFVSAPNHIRAYRKNMGSTSLYTEITPPVNQLIEWQTRGAKFSINGDTYNFPAPASGEFGNYRIFVLGKNKAGKIDTTDTSFISEGIRLYRWRIEKNGNIIQDFIPVRRVSDGMVGMYDFVTGKFFGNAYSSGYFSGE